MLKQFDFIYECEQCGALITLKKFVNLLERNKKIDFPELVSCFCGNNNPNKFKCINIGLKDITIK